MFGLQLARRLAKPKIYDLADFSLWGGSVLDLAGEWGSGRWTVVCRRSTCLGSTSDFHRHYVADSRLVGPPAWCRASCDRDRLPAGPELHSPYSYQKTAAPQMGPQFHYQAAGCDRGDFSAACRKPPCWPFKIVSAVGGHISGNLRLDTANHPAAGTVSRTGSLGARRYFASRATPRSPVGFLLERIRDGMPRASFLSSRGLVRSPQA